MFRLYSRGSRQFKPWKCTYPSSKKKARLHEKKKNNEGGRDRNRYIIREKERMKRKIKRRVGIERVKK